MNPNPPDYEFHPDCGHVHHVDLPCPDPINDDGTCNDQLCYLCVRQ